MHVICMYALAFDREAAAASPAVAPNFRCTHREQNCDTTHVVGYWSFANWFLIKRSRNALLAAGGEVLQLFNGQVEVGEG